jgi:hypothetical protein
VEDVVDTVAAEQEKCTQQHVQIVVQLVKSHSNQRKEDLYTAGIATKNTRNTDVNISILV